MTVTPVTGDDASAYLRRLGVAPGPPGVDQLFALHRAHVERIPYETTWIHLGEAWTTDAEAALARIVRQHRGGYCFHLNGAFGHVLRALGYDVTTHAARVQGAADRPPGPIGDHAALVVRVPDDDGSWLVDAGLGDGLHEPLPLVPGTYRQEPYTFTIRSDDDGTWHLRHDPRGSFAGISFGPSPTADPRDLFATRHAHLSTSPESGFVRAVTVQRRDAVGADILRALTLTRVTDVGDEQLLVTDRTDWFTLLVDRFGLHLADTSAASRDRLWAHANAAHEAHLTTQGG